MNEQHILEEISRTAKGNGGRFSPTKLQEAFPDDYLLEKFIELMREPGRFPVHGEVRLRADEMPTSRTTVPLPASAPDSSLP